MRAVLLAIVAMGSLAGAKPPTVEEAKKGKRAAGLSLHLRHDKLYEALEEAEADGLLALEERGAARIATFPEGPFATVEWWPSDRYDDEYEWVILTLREGETWEPGPFFHPHQISFVHHPAAGTERWLVTGWDGPYLAVEGERVVAVAHHLFPFGDETTPWTDITNNAYDGIPPEVSLPAHGIAPIPADDPRLAWYRAKYGEKGAAGAPGAPARPTASGTYGTGRLVEGGPPHTWSIEGPPGLVRVSMQAWPGRAQWQVSAASGPTLDFAGTDPTSEFELPADGAVVRIQPVGFEDARYALVLEGPDGVAMRSEQGEVRDPPYLSGEDQALGDDERGAAKFTGKETYEHPIFGAPMHTWTLHGNPGWNKRVQIESTSAVAVTDGFRHGQGTFVVLEAVFDASGTYAFQVMPARADTKPSYTVDATGDAVGYANIVASLPSPAPSPSPSPSPVPDREVAASAVDELRRLALPGFTLVSAERVRASVYGPAQVQVALAGRELKVVVVAADGHRPLVYTQTGCGTEGAEDELEAVTGFAGAWGASARFEPGVESACVTVVGSDDDAHDVTVLIWRSDG